MLTTASKSGPSDTTDRDVRRRVGVGLYTGSSMIAIRTVGRSPTSQLGVAWGGTPSATGSSMFTSIECEITLAKRLDDCRLFWLFFLGVDS